VIVTACFVGDAPGALGVEDTLGVGWHAAATRSIAARTVKVRATRIVWCTSPEIEWNRRLGPPPVPHLLDAAAARGDSKKSGSWWPAGAYTGGR